MSIKSRLGLGAGVGAAALATYVGYQMSQEPSGEIHKSKYTADHHLWFERELEGKKEADCFYAHPTTEIGLFTWNTPVTGYATRGKLTGAGAGTLDLMDTQGKAFSEHCNMFVPRYRQMGFVTQMKANPTASDAKLQKLGTAMHMAIGDLKAAFEAFLETRPNKTRPFIIAGHSQGAILMTKVIKDCIVGTEQEQFFVAAYLAGGYVSADMMPLFGDIHVCNGPDDVKCIMSWDTRIEGMFKPQDLNEGMLALYPHIMYWLMFDKYCGDMPTDTDATSKPRVQINPLTWSSVAGAGTGYLGAKHYQEDTPQVPQGDEWAKAVTVEDKGHAIFVPDPRPFMKDAGPAAGHGNLHPAEISLWFFNIKDNVPKRIAAWRSTRQRM